jgi:hypothetical protein
MHNIIIAAVTMAVILPALLAMCVWLARRQGGLTYLANIAEGTHENTITLLTDEVVGTRHLLGKIGSDAGHVAVAGASDIPLGVITDEAAQSGSPVSVEILGISERTLPGVASAAIAAGAFVVPAAGGKLRTLPTAAGTYHIVGRALSAAGADGDTIEFVPCFPIQRVVTA